MRLNKYIAHCGIGTRRSASELVKKKEIKVNGQVQDNPSYTVVEGDEVVYKDKVLVPIKNFEYYLLNKPKGYLTIPKGNKNTRSLFDLITSKSNELMYASDKMEEEDCGLILITNDQSLSEKLQDHKTAAKRIFHIHLDKAVSSSLLKKISNTNGQKVIVNLSHIRGQKENEIGVEILKGNVGMLKDIFKAHHLNVQKIDCTYLHGLTKKDLPRGFSRALTKDEIILFKHLM